MCAAVSADMPTTAPPLSDISLFDLATIIGGCGGKRRQCACPPQQAAPAPQQLPAAAPASDPVVSTNVSLTGFAG